MFRILCPASKSGSFVGDSGEIVARIQKETGAKIRLEEIVSGCDERLILITGSEKDAELGNEPKKEDEVSEGSDNLKESAENVGESEDSTAPESTKVDEGPPLLVNALLLIFERIIENERDNEVDEEENKKQTSVGCLLGKGGSVIKQISADSGAQIHILPKDKLPLCGTQQDEIVQITGGVDSVKKALHLVGQQLLDNPTRERDSFPLANSSGPLSHPFTSIPQLLCPAEKVGSVIGKGGNIVKTLQSETGCEVKVTETNPESENRIIIISGVANCGIKSVISLSNRALQDNDVFPEANSSTEHGEGLSCESKSSVLPKESCVFVILGIDDVAQGGPGS
ncbi:hypothetical protein ZIOFF_009511 [Zingiber officinale]|uniref:K Homology domain-containing protein n=1 Tax=Zingiber officinale TaxID=94328 RepID=A0A8J5HU39_ZINOF|nr:hypothetical protein ZIOFF_009511 [Zingiber officinale]